MTKRITLLVFMTLTLFGLNAQTSKIIKDFENTILNEKKDKQFTSKDFNDIRVSYQYTDSKTDVTHVYLQQYYKNTPIYLGVGAIHYKAGKIVSHTNSMVNNISSKINTTNPKIKPIESIYSVAEELGLESVTINESFLRDQTDGYIFSDVSFASNDVKVSPYYFKSKNETLVLVWNVETAMKDNANTWSSRVDAMTGEVVDQTNNTIYCEFGKPDIIPLDWSQAKSRTNSNLRGDGAKYRVYPLPAESPMHGSHELLVEPSIVEASPLGWHDIDGQEGAEYTITRGNNVWAYLDKSDIDVSGGDEPDGGSELIFDFNHQLNLTGEVNDTAAVTNLFYMNNMIHDITYLLGFNEEAGNFQKKNYSNVGQGKDAVHAQASDGSGTNNANFSTQPEGAPGSRMQMYQWTNSSGVLAIESPEEIAGLITEVGTADFGPSPTSVDITGKLVVVDDGGAVNSSQGCGALVNSDEVSGNIALIDRGECYFSEKTEFAQDAGAIAVIICNIAGVDGNGESVSGMTAAPGAGAITIPTLMVKKSVCDKIRLSISSNIDVEINISERALVGPPSFDAAFDNGVIGHEYGHGISNRLVGGPSLIGCLTNDEQMGEGWSDFWTIVLTTKPGETGAEAKGIGTYVSGQSINGRGIRRYPYSTDMSINPQTFDDIKGTGAPHPVGEVWNSMLIDIYWKFIDLYGFNPDWTDETSGNHRAAHLVIEGMKYTTCNPGFVSARDGILNADYIENEGEHICMLWEVFARRGLGYSAKENLTDNRNDGIEAYDILPVCLSSLKIGKSITSVIKREEEATVIVNVGDYIQGDQTGVKVEEILNEGLEFVEGSANVGVVVGADNKLLFDIGNMSFEEEKEISFKVRPNSSYESSSIFLDDVENTNDPNSKWEEVIISGDDFFYTTNKDPHSTSHSWYIEDKEADLDMALNYGPFVVTGEEPALRFWHQFKTESGNDGGFVQISLDNGNIWLNLDDKFLINGYNSRISYSTFAIPSLAGFTGNSNGYIDSYIDLSQYKGETVKIRFRFGTNEENSFVGQGGGWYIDDLELLDLVRFKTSTCVYSDQSDPVCTEEFLTILDTEFIDNVQDIASIDKFELFPNPAIESTNIRFEANRASSSSISIFNLEGKLVKQLNTSIHSGFNSIVVPLTGLVEGQYLLVVSNDEGQITHKLSVVK